jgi:hypothetical protein
MTLIVRAMSAAAAALLALSVHADQHYAFDAAGRAARIGQSWPLRPEENRTIDILLSVVRCGSQMFLADSQNRVFRVDLNAATATLHPFAGEEQGIGRPTALAVDCERQRLYVVNLGPRTVVTLNTVSGAVVSTQPFKRELYETRSAALAGPDALYIAGLWNSDPARGLPRRDVDSFFEATWLGEKLSLTDGNIEGALPPYETRCGAAGACAYADLDRVSGAGSTAWVAAQGTSTRVALYDARGGRTATVDVTSPKFLRDGTEMPVAIGGDVIERWKSRNSIIRRVFAIGDRLVTIHTLTELGPNWQFGQQTGFSVFMNIHALDGRPLVSDVKLVDVPIGRDDANLYAVDYGAAGRRNGATDATLVRIPITAGPDAIR